MGEVKPVKMDNWAPTDSTTLFADGERVLCFHGPLIYEAKVLKTKPESSPVEYYIHYAGWSKNWDEWVPESRVLKYNDDNVKRQKELARLYVERSKKDNKKGSAKAKKMEHVGNESRASTPSKDSSQTQPSTGVTSATTSTPIAAGQSKTKNDGSNTSSNSSTTTNNTSITSTTSRSNRKSTQSATAAVRPSTPSADKKDDSAAAENTEEEVTTPSVPPPPPKAKRMSSQNSNTEQRSALSGNGTEAATAHQSTTTTAATATTPTAATTTTTTIADAPCVESEETYTAKLEVKIKIPDELKHYLTDDWYAIVREHKLLELPAKVTVQQIAEQYLAHKKSVKSTSASKEVAINDVLDGIIEYFNVMLGSQLLYKFERTQYADIMQKNPDTPLSELYGSFHLLRLFVRLGSMLSYSALDQPAMQTLLAHLHDFLKFLVKNSAMYFNMTNFINVDPEYVRNAQ
ncbi:nuA4 complex subunit EAF3 homolog [Drosophila hydei]|uniref:NuA4 complex subunit EAF3 homolog n=1 Tax=Drosophila hydei TaxID=7224 RepID=A0A6J1MGN2_DROHY|nr:nuA4 complex subunit EAF3 homolog [Drosophila hydei]